MYPNIGSDFCSRGSPWQLWIRGIGSIFGSSFFAADPDLGPHSNWIQPLWEIAGYDEERNVFSDLNTYGSSFALGITRHDATKGWLDE